jgi:uncharacterized cupin superfamily protein
MLVRIRAVVLEAPLERVGAGLSPKGEGWFVVNAREARWLKGHFGAYTPFEGDIKFPQLGINIGVLEPGQPSCWYHREDEQEDFLVLHGEALLLIEDQERPLKTWDFVHCPRWTNHVFVGAGDGPCAILAVGARTDGDIVYPVSEVALNHRAGVEHEATSGKDAYAGVPKNEDAEFDQAWLP